jgi:hypothetical protein
MKQLAVQLGNDQLARFSKASSLQAIEELLSNAYDADANTIDIVVEYDKVGLGVVGLRICDDGTAIPYDKLAQAFEFIGDSMKQGMRLTPGGRIPRGKLGRGRFKAFALSNTVQWISRYQDGSVIREFTIHGDGTKPQPFQASDPAQLEPGAKTGVEVIVRPINRAFSELTDPAHVVRELSKRMALELFQHPVNIRYDGHRVNPEEFIDHREAITIKVADESGEEQDVTLTVIEWKGIQAKALYFCNSEGVAEHELEKFEVTSGRNFSYTVYAQSPFVDRLISTNTLDLGELNNEVRGINAATRRALESHFRTRMSTLAGGLVAEWRKEGIYPFPETDPNPVERVSREVFDVCAQTVQELLPSFESGAKANRKLLFRLLKQAIETDSGSLCDILEQVLTLEKQQQDALAGILKNARLGAVIGAAKTVLDRLKFLEATQHLFFGPHAGDVNEPHQLQQILLKELWLFGDEFSFGRQEAYLVKALEEHAKHTGRAFNPSTGAICNIKDKTKSRLDIMLNSTYKRTDPYDFEHLVIELKRSTVRLGAKELGQIDSYALTVGNDKRFDKAKTKWTWYLVGVECDEFAEAKRMSEDRPAGLLTFRAGVQVWVKTWAEIVSAAKRRYEFFLNELEVELTADDGLRYLREQHTTHLPASLLNPRVAVPSLAVPIVSPVTTPATAAPMLPAHNPSATNGSAIPVTKPAKKKKAAAAPPAAPPTPSPPTSP